MPKTSPKGMGINKMNETKELVRKENVATNGKDKKLVDRKQPGQPKPEEKTDVVVKTEVVEQKVELTIEDKIQKLDDLNNLVEKRNRLKESANKLKSFDLKREAHSTEITLTDESGNRFKTSNTKAVESFIRMTEQVIFEELTSVESKIQF